MCVQLSCTFSLTNLAATDLASIQLYDGHALNRLGLLQSAFDVLMPAIVLTVDMSAPLVDHVFMYYLVLRMDPTVNNKRAVGLQKVNE